jgi:site-specific DNA-methyltransferase (cytosine-N4-specific)
MTILHGDCLDMLSTLPENSVQVCVTSPPYYGLRQYLKPDHPDFGKQLGLERTFDCLGWATKARCGECFICRLTAVFAEVRRVLRKDGTLWLNIGDSYANPDKGGYQNERNRNDSLQVNNLASDFVGAPNRQPQGWLKPKDLMLAPERLALSLQADGWYLRSRIIWHKLSAMPESTRDRPTKSHEHIWLLSKSERYFYSDEAKEPASPDTHARYARGRSDDHKYADGGPGDQTINRGFQHMVGHGRNERPRKAVPNDAPGPRIKNNESFDAAMRVMPDMRNWRDVWPIGPEPYKEAHFATFPTEIPRRAIVAGSRPGDTVLDPFNGSGTTGQVAAELGRQYIGIELNAEYIALAEKRLRGITVGLPLEAAAE